jgi:hypothetical protein
MTFKNVKTVNGRLALHPAEALVLAGFSKDIEAAKSTARNKIYDRTYPLKLSQERWPRLVGQNVSCFK